MRSRPLHTVTLLFSFLIVAALASSAQTFTTLVNFDDANGAWPERPLVQGTDGSFYGTTAYGGSKDRGTVFKVTPAGVLTTLYRFNGKNGKAPTGMVLAPGGNFYGTTYYGGTNNGGTVFRITPHGYLTSLYSFGGVGYPSGPLIQGTDGNYYGTTVNGGTNGSGILFKITPNGTLTTVYTFCSQPNCMDGGMPFGPLLQGIDGNFYGTDFSGGTSQFYGTVFKITPTGTLTTLYNFCSRANCADGFHAVGLVQAADGNFYGATGLGGSYSDIACSLNGCGTIFKLTPDGTFTTLYTFCSTATCPDGNGPGPLIQATDGNFYGTTFLGGLSSTCSNSNGCGTAFQISPSGQLTKLHDFSGADGTYLGEGMLQATDGNLYGTTAEGGTYNYGTVFSLSMGFGPFVRLVRNSGRVGQTGGILGQGFTGTTGVFLNGTPASFTVVSDTYILATVPAGATTGFVTVDTPSGTLKSDVVFHLR